jgi:thioesterase domain-containing protein/acyl carrier protein
MYVSALPTTASGKLDKAALPAPSPQATGRADARPPRNDTERRVAALWSDLLATPVTDVNSDFFHIGGHSVLASQLVVEVRRAFGVALSLAAFVDHGKTVAELAELLDAESLSGTGEVTLRPPLHFIFYDLASAMSLRHFSAQWGAAQPVEALILEQPRARFDRSMSIEEHATYALSMIRDRQPDGPIALAGFSILGLVAYEVARQAVDAGQQVDWLGIVDMEAPPTARLMQARQTLRSRLGRLRELRAREWWAKLASVGGRVLRGGLGSLQIRDDEDTRVALQIACCYLQPGHDVPMHLFVSEATVALMKSDTLGWNEFHKGKLTVDRLGGDHAALLELPQAKELARMMLEPLRQARG